MLKILKFIGALLGLIFTSIVCLAVYILVDFSPDPIPKPEVPNQINDVTQLNPVSVSTMVKPKTKEEIIQAIRATSGPVSIGGGKNSQGGQTAFPDSLHLDMRDFNQVLHFDNEARLVTVQSGIRWRDLQAFIDPHDLSIKIMQTYANFTVGGSLSVNVHGRYIGEGPMIRSVESFKILLANGEEKNVSQQTEPELYFSAIGGYGAIGIVTEVTLQLAENSKVERQTEDMALGDYHQFFKTQIRDNREVVFHNADIFPPDYLAIRSVSWLITDADLTIHDRLIPANQVYWWQPRVAEFVADSGFGKWLRQHVLEPLLYSFEAVQWRNYEASYDINELEPKSRDIYTYALREYFVPVENFDAFVAKMTSIFQQHQANIINVSVRHALPDPGSYLAWAPEEVFAFVVYYRQGTDGESKAKVAKWSQAMIDAAISEGGRYYLPYQLHATKAQFRQAYPGYKTFIEVKQKYDPENRFQNLFLDKYLAE